MGLAKLVTLAAVVVFFYGSSLACAGAGRQLPLPAECPDLSGTYHFPGRDEANVSCEKTSKFGFESGLPVPGEFGYHQVWAASNLVIRQLDCRHVLIEALAASFHHKSSYERRVAEYGVEAISWDTPFPTLDFRIDEWRTIELDLTPEKGRSVEWSEDSLRYRQKFKAKGVRFFISKNYHDLRMTLTADGDLIYDYKHDEVLSYRDIRCLLKRVRDDP